MIKTAVLVSGKGSNLLNLLQAIEDGHLPYLNIHQVIADRDCVALTHSVKKGIPSFCLDRGPELCKNIDSILQKDTDLILMAGFLSILDGDFCQKWAGKLINLHPSLLPKYGGKGMYGIKVHRAVLKNKETQSGATVHYVIPEVDAGEIILQKACAIGPGETPESLAKKIHHLEHELLIKALKKLSVNQGSALK